MKITFSVRRLWFGDAKAKRGLQNPVPLKFEKPIDIVGFSFSQCVNMRWRSEVIISKQSKTLTELDSKDDIVYSAGLTPENPTATVFFPSGHYLRAEELLVHFFSCKRGDCGWSVFVYYC